MIRRYLCQDKGNETDSNLYSVKAKRSRGFWLEERQGFCGLSTLYKCKLSAEGGTFSSSWITFADFHAQISSIPQRTYSGLAVFTYARKRRSCGEYCNKRYDSDWYHGHGRCYDSDTKSTRWKFRQQIPRVSFSPTPRLSLADDVSETFYAGTIGQEPLEPSQPPKTWSNLVSGNVNLSRAQEKSTEGSVLSIESRKRNHSADDDSDKGTIFFLKHLNHIGVNRGWKEKNLQESYHPERISTVRTGGKHRGSHPVPP